MGYFADREIPVRPGFVDPRKLPGNPLVKLRYWRIQARFYGRRVCHLVKLLNIQIPRGYWILDNKIKGIPKTKNFAYRKHWRGFNKQHHWDPEKWEDECLSFSDTEIEPTEIESPSPSTEALGHAMQQCSLMDMPLLCPVGAPSDIFAVHLVAPQVHHIVLDD